jgi:hypothetical protein
MQMNKQNRRRLTLASFLAVLVLLIAAVSSSAAENEPLKQQPEPAAQKPAETSAETTIDPAKTPQTGQPAPAAAGTAATPIKQFEPSEKIGADSAVAFPIDI